MLSKFLVFALLVLTTSAQADSGNGSGNKTNITACFSGLKRLSLGGTLEEQLDYIGKYRSQEVKLTDGKYYSVAIDAEKDLRVVSALRDESNKLQRPLLDFEFFDPISLRGRENEKTYQDLTINKVTPLFLLNRLFLLSQNPNGLDNVIYDVNLKKRYITKPARFTDPADIEGINRQAEVIPRDDHSLFYIRSIKQRIPGSGEVTTVYSRIISAKHPEWIKQNNVDPLAVGQPQVLFRTQNNFGKVHILHQGNGKFIAAQVTDSFLNSNQLSFQVFEAGAGIQAPSYTIKILEKINSLQSVRILQNTESTQLYVLIEANNKYFTSPLAGGAVAKKGGFEITATKGAISIRNFMDYYNVLSEQVFSDQDLAIATNNKTVRPMASKLNQVQDHLYLPGNNGSRVYEGVAFPLTSEQHQNIMTRLKEQGITPLGLAPKTPSVKVLNSPVIKSPGLIKSLLNDLMGKSNNDVGIPEKSKKLPILIKTDDSDSRF